MQRKYIVFLSLVLFAGSLINITMASGSQTGGKEITYINGQILGSNGKKFVMANVQLADIGETNFSTIQSIPADAHGKFRIEIKASGLYKLLISAVNHQSISIPLNITAKDRKIDVTATLSPYNYRKPIDAVKIIGSWNNYDYRKAENMQKQADGSFSYEKEVSDSAIGYQLMGVVDAQAVDGTMADYPEYDNNGNYRSVLKVNPGKINIIFDPSKLIYATNDQHLPTVSFDNKHKVLETVFTISNRFNQQNNEYLCALKQYRDTHQSLKDFVFDSSDLSNFLIDTIKSTKNESIVRQFAAVTLIRMLTMNIKMDKITPAEILQVVPADSPLWGVEPYAVVMLGYYMSREQAVLLLKEFYEKNPDRRVQARALLNMAMAAKERNDKEKTLSIYDELKNKYGDIREIQSELAMLNPNKKIAQGKPLPEFKVKLLENETMITNQSMRGKYYLVDFWATWCGGCNDEMLFLHKAYERFKNDNFEILSLSVDEGPEDVRAFHKKWPMPWLNAVLDGGIIGQTAQDFDVRRLPAPILVGPDGMIVTIDNLRGESLEKTLEIYLKK
jgi:thiol-disulfide isomerase/thioredoxin